MDYLKKMILCVISSISTVSKESYCQIRTDLTKNCFRRMNSGKGLPRNSAGELNCYEILPSLGISDESITQFRNVC